MLYDALLRHCCPEANILPRIPSRLKVMSCRMMAKRPWTLPALGSYTQRASYVTWKDRLLVTYVRCGLLFPCSRD